MSKVTVRKYQRELVPYFKKYQLTELEGDKHTSILDAGAQMNKIAQGLLENDEEQNMLDNRKEMLVQTVSEHFDSEINQNDLAILYEITGYQGENPPNEYDFWSNYANFKILGAAQNDINCDGGDPG